MIKNNKIHDCGRLPRTNFDHGIYIGHATRAMRAVVITKNGGPDVLEVQERPDPEVKPGEIRIAVKASGINFADLMARSGIYPDAPKPPSVIGYEVAGEVESVGDGVEDYAVGDRVAAGTRFGGYAELVSVPVRGRSSGCRTRSRSSRAPRSP